MATEDDLRSRRTFKTTSARNTHDEDSMEVDAVSRKGKGKEKSCKGKKGGKKGKEIHSGKCYGECRNCESMDTHDSMENVETVESMDTKHLIVGASRRTNLKVRQGHGKVEIQGDRNQ